MINYPDDKDIVILRSGELRSLLKKARTEKVSHRTFRQAFRKGLFAVIKGV